MFTSGGLRPTTFAAFLQHHRRSLQLSRRQLASRAGIPASRIIYLERVPSVSRISPATLFALARALDVPLADLLEAAGYTTGHDGHPTAIEVAR